VLFINNDDNAPARAISDSELLLLFQVLDGPVLDSVVLVFRRHTWRRSLTQLRGSCPLCVIKTRHKVCILDFPTTDQQLSATTNAQKHGRHSGCSGTCGGDVSRQAGPAADREGSPTPQRHALDPLQGCAEDGFGGAQVADGDGPARVPAAPPAAAGAAASLPLAPTPAPPAAAPTLCCADRTPESGHAGLSVHTDSRDKVHVEIDTREGGARGGAAGG
jgi:hypothetical protein